MKKLLLTNVAYGNLYAELFLENQLKSLLDETNLPAVRERCEYVLFTDGETKPKIEAHPNYKRLCETVPTKLQLFGWGGVSADEAHRFDFRYSVLVQTFLASVEIALERNCLLSAWVADLVCAQGFLPKVLARIDAGYDSVLMLPLRAAVEGMHKQLTVAPGALTPDELFKAGYANLHPLWVACHWEAPQFTKLPFSLIWNTGEGLLVRSFSITPIIFQPTPEMLKARAVIDVEVPAYCKNPYWAEDWTEAPLIGAEPLFCYYPTFSNRPARPAHIREWVSKNLHEKQPSYLRKELYFPDRKTVAHDEFLFELKRARADHAVAQITGGAWPQS